MLSRIKIENDSMVDLALAVEYESEYGKYRDVLYLEKLIINDETQQLPQKIKQSLISKEAGYTEKFHFNTGELIETHKRSQLYTIRNQDFNYRIWNRLKIKPQVGRFYPAGWFDDINEKTVGKMTAVRIIEANKEIIRVDCNHPLSGYELDVDVKVLNVYKNAISNNKPGKERLNNLWPGPGMQLRYRKETATDFFSNEPFMRSDETTDDLFYSKPRMVNHLDATALQQLQSLYAELIPEHARILDLMSSMNSHLPQNIKAQHITGLGLNSQELETNSSLNEKLVHDLNDDPALPFDENSYDIVVCTVSVEYLVKPFEVFNEVARVLKEEGKFIVTFSNRWFPTKAIQLWSNLHEFERMGLVSEYFIGSGQFKNINTRSIRGLERPYDDHHKLPLSDPLYAVWGEKIYMHKQSVNFKRNAVTMQELT